MTPTKNMELGLAEMLAAEEDAGLSTVELSHEGATSCPEVEK